MTDPLPQSAKDAAADYLREMAAGIASIEGTDGADYSLPVQGPQARSALVNPSDRDARARECLAGIVAKYSADDAAAIRSGVQNRRVSNSTAVRAMLAFAQAEVGCVPEGAERAQALEEAAKVADAAAARLLPHETTDENSRWLQASCKMARAEAESIARLIRALSTPEAQS